MADLEIINEEEEGENEEVDWLNQGGADDDFEKSATISLEILSEEEGEEEFENFDEELDKKPNYLLIEKTSPIIDEDETNSERLRRFEDFIKRLQYIPKIEELQEIPLTDYDEERDKIEVDDSFASITTEKAIKYSEPVVIEEIDEEALGSLESLESIVFEQSLEEEEIDYEYHQRMLKSVKVKEDKELDLEWLAARSFCALLIEELILNTVKYWDLNDPEKILRRKIYKMNKMEEITKLVKEFNSEIVCCELRERKLVEYFRRRNNLRPLSKGKEDISKRKQEQYHEVLDNINNSLGKLSYLEHNVALKKDDIGMTIDNIKAEINTNTKNFQDLVMRTFCKDSSEKLKRLVPLQLTKMLNMRKPISEIRKKLILRQHTQEVLRQKIKAIDELNKDLPIEQYKKLLFDIEGLGKKIEERNNELVKYRLNSNAAFHATAHYRDCRVITNENISMQKAILRELFYQKQSLRTQLHNLKKQRVAILHETIVLTNKTELRSMPRLLHDYDRLMDAIELKKENINKLKADQIILNNKIQRLETL